ncbi:hypothetical protein QBC36DRAFT_78777 [Triangularia setosa]|uniref:Uncharacterized protein n=1 Tax=Triangularia setosa TaxID=2587417 RepID=A0AAN6WC99_9PEZI|nr:hypothetical protein QBC36DRAFT_78777 [Podospora setosa]
MSSIVNKIKEAVHSDNKAHHGAPEGTSGPHNSRVANAADPRVDSDRDGSHTAGRTTGTTGTTGVGRTTGTTGTTGVGRTAGHGEFGSGGYGTGTSEGISGPHNSRVANTLDPRVDSDRDGSRTTGNTAGTGFGNTASTGFGNTSRTTGTTEGLHGPHSSRAANTLDPRVDSDRDGSNTLGSSGTGTHTTAGFGGNTGIGSGNTHRMNAGTGKTGLAGTHGDPAGTHGPHNSRIANAADPRVDSDRDGRGAIRSGPGPAGNTAGPHSSDMANKLDPRVDSDLDGSKTVGQNRTYQSGTTTTTSRDPTDAAQVPPSVLRKHLGDPVVEHDDHHHHRERRNSVKTHQEAFSGI